MKSLCLVLLLTSAVFAAWDKHRLFVKRRPQNEVIKEVLD